MEIEEEGKKKRKGERNSKDTQKSEVIRKRKRKKEKKRKKKSGYRFTVSGSSQNISQRNTSKDVGKERQQMRHSDTTHKLFPMLKIYRSLESRSTCTHCVLKEYRLPCRVPPTHTNTPMPNKGSDNIVKKKKE
jgi:hypothetical protein